MVSSTSVWLSLISASCYQSFANAIPVHDDNAILAQIKSSGACCSALNQFLPGKVHFNTLTDLGYQTSQASFYSAQEASLHPTCIVVPTSTQDVSTAVKILSFGNRAKAQGCQFAVRSAGHTPNAGSANIDGGVTIHLESLNQVAVSKDQKIVSVGPGNRWINVYSKLDPLDLSMVGGRSSTVGVGGLITGGGVSFYSGRFGFSCDNIEQYEIVLADGTVTTASRTKNPLLFKALKGGSNNFGIVTRFDAKLHQQKAFWGGTVYQEAYSSRTAVFDFVSTLSTSSSFDPNSALIASMGWAPQGPIFAHFVAYTDGSVAWPPPAFEKFEAIPKIASTVRTDKLSNFTLEIGTTTTPTIGKQNVFVTLTFVNKPGVAQDFMEQFFQLADATAKELTTVLGLIYAVTFQPMPHALYSKSAATGGNVLGLNRFSDDLINLLVTVSWELETDNARVEAAIKKLEADAIAAEKQKGIFNEFIYLNYAAGWQSPIQGYGKENVAFMKSVSKKYDPNGIFQTGVPGGFKLPA